MSKPWRLYPFMVLKQHFKAQIHLLIEDITNKKIMFNWWDQCYLVLKKYKIFSFVN
jgi:hypothetical protein